MPRYDEQYIEEQYRPRTRKEQEQQEQEQLQFQQSPGGQPGGGGQPPTHDAIEQFLLEKQAVSGVLDITDGIDQLRLFNLLPRNISVEDVTGDKVLRNDLKAQPNRILFLLGDGILKAGRTYKANFYTKTNTLTSEVIGTALDATVVLRTTSTPQSRRKENLQVFMSFWTADTNPRVTHQTAPGTERVILIEAVYTAPVLPNTGMQSDGSTQTETKPFETRFTLFEVSPTVNPTLQLAGTIVLFFPDMHLPRFWEVRVTIGGVLLGPTTIADLAILLDAE